MNTLAPLSLSSVKLPDALLSRLLPQLSDNELLDLIVEQERLVRAAHAEQLVLLAQFARRRPRCDAQGLFDESAADEIASLLKWTRLMATRRLALAAGLARRLPATLAALRHGRLDLAKAEVVERMTRPLNPERAAEVETRVLARAPEQTRSQLAQSTRRAVHRVDPEGAASRHAERRRGRKVNLVDQEDGMAELVAYLPAEQASAGYQRLTALAHQAKTAGDHRSIDERRADALADLLLGAPAGHGPGPCAQVHVTVPASTLLGMDAQPGELAGYGPITAEVARQLASGGTWRRMLTDPVSGAMLDYGHTTHQPSATLANHVRARDRTCRFPGCQQPASRCAVEHTRSYPEGRTSPANLGLLCRHHRQLKQRGGWRAEQPRPGSFVWTSPTGRRYTRDLEPLVEPQPARSRTGNSKGTKPRHPRAAERPEEQPMARLRRLAANRFTG